MVKSAPPRPPLTALVVRLVRVVPAVVVHVALPRLGDTPSVPAPELPWAAGAGSAVGGLLIGTVAAVVLVVALPRFRDAPLVGTLPLVCFTLVRRCVQRGVVT